MNGVQSNRLARQLALVRSDAPDLTQRQLAMLMVVAWTPGPHTVRDLAETLCVAKPVITRASDRLVAAGMVQRRVDEADRRSVILTATEWGRGFLDRDAGLAVAA